MRKKKELKTKGENGLKGKKQFDNWKAEIAALNAEIEKLITYIDKNATTFLHTHFQFKNLKIVVKVKKGFDFRKIGTTANYELLPPFIKLSIQQLKPPAKPKDIDRPQSFLNEAKLTAIALSIRFTILAKRPKKPEIKILALDDLLISLDMSNRMDVLKMNQQIGDSWWMIVDSRNSAISLLPCFFASLLLCFLASLLLCFLASLLLCFFASLLFVSSASLRENY